MTTHYVATDGNDGNGGTDPTTDAKATLDGALAIAADGDTIEMVGGTYTDQIDINADENAKDITIKPYNGGAVAFEATGSAYCMLVANAAATKTLEFQDISFSLGDSSRTYPIYHLGQKSLTFTRCTFTLTSGDVYAVYATAGTNAVDRVLTFSDCTFNASASTASKGFAGVTDGSVYISGGTFTMNDASYPIVQIGTTAGFGTLEIDGLTSSGDIQYIVGQVGTLSDGTIRILNSTISDINGPLFAVGTADAVYVADNTFNGDSANASRTTQISGAGVADTGYFYFARNTCNDFSGGFNITDDCQIQILHNTINVSDSSTSPICQLGTDNWVTVNPENNNLGDLSRRTMIVGNDFNVTGDGDRHSAFLGMKYAGIVFAHNRIRHQSTDVSYGLVVKACGASIVGNVVDSNTFSLYMVGATGCTVCNNTFVANTGTVLGFSDQGRDPDSNAIFNNVLYCRDSSGIPCNWQALTDTFGNLVDYNMLFPSRIKFDDTEYTTVSAIEAAQSAYRMNGISGEGMHGNCLFVDPRIENDTAYRLLNSKCYSDGLPKTGGTQGSLGALDPPNAVIDRSGMQIRI